MRRDVRRMSTATQIPVAYKCKFCGRNGETSYSSDCPPLRLERWLPLLACNRCADFHRSRNRLVDDVWAHCYSLSLAIESHAHDREMLAEVRTLARERLNRKTKAFAALVCAFHHKAVIWEPDFTQMLLDAPRKCHQILSHYERGVAP